MNTTNNGTTNGSKKFTLCKEQEHHHMVVVTFTVKGDRVTAFTFATWGGFVNTTEYSLEEGRADYRRLLSEGFKRTE